MTGPLKLLAKDDEDVKLVAAMTQDAIAPVSEMAFRAAEKRFVMVAHRFRWDCLKEKPCPEGEGVCFERVQSALDIQGAGAVQCAGFDPATPGLMLDLLTIKLDPDGLSFVFAGGMDIKVTLGKDWVLTLEDFGEPWPTPRLPRHQA